MEGFVPRGTPSERIGGDPPDAFGLDMAGPGVPDRVI
jgi:hypothetical protein